MSPEFSNGISFLCPHCHSTRLAVFFVPPIDPEGWGAVILGGGYVEGQKKWTREGGETFENLSLTPSIDFSRHGHWHGHVVAGEVR